MLLLLALTTLAFAEEKILVTATRTGTSTNDLPFSANSISGESWQAGGGQAETALASIPGLSLSTNGGPGQTRSLRIRGANAEHTLVLIDGIPASDPLSPSRSFDFGQIPVDDIERVEVIKGPQSVLYGSDAMGGVVQIFTKRDNRSRARAEAGSYGTMKANLSHLGFRAGYAQSRGFSAADERDGNSEPDGYRSWNVGGFKEYPVTDSFLMRLNAQYADTRVDTDRNGGAGGDSRNTFSQSGVFLLREENIVLLPGDAEWTLAGSFDAHDRDDNTNGTDFYRSSRWKAESLLRKPIGRHGLTGGLEYGEEAGRSSQIVGIRRFRTGGAFLQDQAKWERFHANAGARIDLHSESETAQTYRLGLGYWIAPEHFRVKGSLGTGFKAPSLFQTYSIFGSPHLKPERSVGMEAGLELLSEDWDSELTFFRNRFRDLIDFNLVTNRFFNQTRAETYGAEWALERRLGLFHLGNAATLMRAYDPDSGKVLLRRPRFTNTIDFHFRKGDFVGAGLLLRYVGTREDTHPVLNTRQTMPAYFTLGADFFHHLGEGLRLVGRGENLLNRNYQDVSGFGVPAFSLYGGIEAEL